MAESHAVIGKLLMPKAIGAAVILNSGHVDQKLRIYLGVRIGMQDASNTTHIMSLGLNG